LYTAATGDQRAALPLVWYVSAALLFVDLTALVLTLMAVSVLRRLPATRSA